MGAWTKNEFLYKPDPVTNDFGRGLDRMDLRMGHLFCVTDPKYGGRLGPGAYPPKRSQDWWRIFQDVLDDIAAAEGGVMVIPKGEYRISKTLEVKHPNTHIWGHGKDITTIWFAYVSSDNVGIPAILVRPYRKGQPIQLERAVWKDFTIDCQPGKASAAVDAVHGMWRCHFQNVNVKNRPVVGLDIGWLLRAPRIEFTYKGSKPMVRPNAYGNTWEMCETEGCRRAGWHLGDLPVFDKSIKGSKLPPNQLAWNGNVFSNCRAYGSRISWMITGEANTFVNCAIAASQGRYPVVVVGPVQYPNNFINTYFDCCDKRNILVMVNAAGNWYCPVVVHDCAGMHKWSSEDPYSVEESKIHDYTREAVKYFDFCKGYWFPGKGTLANKECRRKTSRVRLFGFEDFVHQGRGEVLMKSIAEQVTMSIPPKDDKAFRITVNDEEQKLTELFAIPGKAMAGAEHEARFGTKGPRVLFGSVDPRHRGVDAPVGSLYSNTTDGTLYSKVGKGIEQWRAHVFK